MTATGESALAAELAHDLRTPLSSVLVAAELLQDGRLGPLNALQREQVRLMQAAARTACQVTDDVLDMARAGGGVPLGPRVPFSMEDVLATVRDIVQPTAAARGIQLRLRCSAAEPRLGHPRALERVLLNLVGNAVKCTDEGWVELSARPEGAEPELVCVAVRDTGRGVSRAAAEALLEPVAAPYVAPYAAHDAAPYEAAASHGAAGSARAGLGLVVCRRLLTAMGGTLRLDPRVAPGARFHFTLALPFARD